MRNLEDSNKSGNENYKLLLDKLKLDIKTTIAPAKGSETYLAALKSEILETPDPDIRAFVSLISSGRKRKPRKLFIVAAGQMAFSSILLFMGLVLIFPTFFYYANPEVILNYFGSYIVSVPPDSIESTVILAVDFIISVIMLLSAFQIIRFASDNMKEAGLTVTDAN